MHKASDYKKEELNKFVESLTSEDFGKIQKFYNTMPRLQHEVEVENPKTKVKSKIMCGRSTKFFRIASHTTKLENYFQVNFALMQHHKYSLTELENMV